MSNVEVRKDDKLALMLTEEQLVENLYPIPKDDSHLPGFVSLPALDPVVASDPHAPLFAIDCEMVCIG